MDHLADAGRIAHRHPGTVTCHALPRLQAINVVVDAVLDALRQLPTRQLEVLALLMEGKKLRRNAGTAAGLRLVSG